MIKQILKQIWCQRRQNGWIYLELLIVFVLAWYIFDYGFMMLHNRLLPRGVEIDDTYRIYCRDIESDEDRAALEIFKGKVSHFPGVKSILLSDKWGGVTPFNGSYSGSSISRDTLSGADKYHVQVKEITSNNYFDIFGVRSIAYPDRMGRLDFSDRNAVAISETAVRALFGSEDPIGQTIFYGGKEVTVVDVLVSQKRYDFYTPGRQIYVPVEESEITMPELSIKVDERFSLEQFREEVSSSITTYMNVKHNMEMMDGTTMNIKLRASVMIFFLLNISLGVIGTFWFRNQSRRGEIGLRMSMGSTRKQVLCQFVSEALLLLTLASIPAIIVVALLLNADIIEVIGISTDTNKYLTQNIWLRGAITVAITYILLAVIVTLSVWIPAHRASNVNPVEALREE